MEPQIGFSRAVRSGQYVVVAGTAPIGDDGSTVGPGDVYAQTVRCLDIAERALQEAGASLDDVVKTTVFLVDMSEWGAMNAVYMTYFPNKPARSAIGTQLLGNARVEIECIAKR